MVLRTFEADKDLYEQFKALMAKENANIGDKINEMIKEYIKVHGDGNPGFTMDQFIDNPQMKAVPAFFRTLEDWEKYLYNLPQKEQQEILWQAQGIGARVKKRMDQA